MVQAAQDDAGEVDGLGEVAHQRALKSNHVPPAGDGAKLLFHQAITNSLCQHIGLLDHAHFL